MPKVKNEKPQGASVYYFEFTYQETHFAVVGINIPHNGWFKLEAIGGMRFCDMHGNDVSDSLYMTNANMIDLISRGEIVPIHPFEKYDGIYVGDRVLNNFN